MFYSKTTKIGKRTGKKNIGSFLATLFCTLVITSTIGYSFVIRNSFVQAQLLTPSGSSWSNNMHVLCAHECVIHLPSLLACPLLLIPDCHPANTRHHNGNESIVTGPQTFTNSKTLNLNHSFVSNKVIGPDRFRFVTSYWTTGLTHSRN